MSGVSPGQRGLRSKTSELNLFRDRGSNTSRLHSRPDHHLVPPVPALATPDYNKPKRKLALWGKRRKSGSVSPSQSARPSGDSTGLFRKSGETVASSYKTVQSLSTSGQDLTPTRLPSKLPPLDVSPPSLNFPTSLSPFSSRNQPSLGYKHHTGITSRDRSSPVGTRSNRPLITVTIPPSNAFNEADEDVFASPRSAPTPPQLTVPLEYGSPASLPSSSAPGSPLRFPVPPPQGDITASSSFPNDPFLHGRSSEFNADFSFPRKEDCTIRNTGRNTSLDLPPMRPLERKMNLRKANSTASKSQVSSHTGPGFGLLPESRGVKVPRPPSIPLPAPPSTFPTDTDDHIADKVPINSSASSLIFVQTRPLPMTVSSSSSSLQRDEPKEDERTVPQQSTRKRAERRNQLTADQRDQTLLRVEASAQRVRLDELAIKFQEFSEENERERKELTARLADVERLVEQQQEVIKHLESMVSLRNTGRIEWAPDMAAIMGHTPDFGSSMFSPVVTFENGSRSLKRSNTLPDGHLDWAKQRGSSGEADGKRNSQDWSRFIKETSLGSTNRCEGEPAGSPVVREDSESTLVSSPSPSDLVSRITHEARSGDVNHLGAGEDVPDHERMKQWTPNMQEILAKLRTFESRSPNGR